MYSPCESLSKFVEEKQLKEVLVVWPTGLGKTNAAVSLLYDLYARNDINYVIACTLKNSLKRNLQKELSKFFIPDVFRVYSMQSLFKELKVPHSALNRRLEDKRVGFLLDEVDQIIPRVDHHRPAKATAGDDDAEVEDEDVFHWKSEYYEKLKKLFNEGLCGLTRILVFLTATPFVNDIDNETEKYKALMFRNTYENRHFENDSKKFLSSRIHYLPLDVTRDYYSCTVRYQRSNIVRPVDELTMYKPYRLNASQKILRDYEKNPNDMLALFPESASENPKLAHLIDRLEMNVTLRVLVICYLKESQKRTVRALQNAGIKVMELVSEMTANALHQSINTFNINHSYRVLSTTEFFSSGFSVMETVEVVIFEGFPRSEPATTVQGLGRVVRVDSHSLRGTIVDMYMYVYDNVPKESKRYATAIRKQVEFDKFFETVKADHREFFEKTPLVHRLPPIKSPPEAIQPETANHRALAKTVKSRPTDKKLLFVSEDFECDLATACEIALMKPVGKGTSHVIFGSLVRTLDDVYDTSACNYYYELKPEDAYDDRAKAIIKFVERKTAEGASEDETWMAISGENDANEIRKHEIDANVRKAVRTGKKIRTNALRGATIVNNTFPRILGMLGVSVQQPKGPVRRQLRESFTNAVYLAAIKTNSHLDYLVDVD